MVKTSLVALSNGMELMWLNVEKKFFRNLFIKDCDHSETGVFLRR